MAGQEGLPTKGEVILEAKDIVKNYGYLQALKGASLKIYAGEITALLGDNGAGKSTMANIICGAIPKSSGHLYVKGKEIEVQSIQQAQEMGIQVVYQDLALAPDESVRNLVSLEAHASLDKTSICRNLLLILGIFCCRIFLLLLV